MRREFVLKISLGLIVLVIVAFAASQAWAVVHCIEVTKSCTDGAEPGMPILYSGSIHNCGLQNITVTVTDVTADHPIYVDELLLGGLELYGGETKYFSGLYYPDVCGPSTNVIEAVGEFSAIVNGKDYYVRLVDTAEATCEVPCDSNDGCTLTSGYWKTRSKYGPAPYDDTWTSIGSGAGSDTPFFLSGKSYHDVLWTVPKGGNAYYILAHAFIAAELNIAAEASMPGDVASAWSEAKVYFETYTPNEIKALGKKVPLRGWMIDLAEIIDNYNNGITGPGHCE